MNLCVSEEMKNSISIPSNNDLVVCPKPRRIGLVHLAVNDQVKTSRFSIRGCSNGDSKAGAELLDLILTKGGYITGGPSSSPPFFCGSPPSRASNPLIQDEQFGVEKTVLLSPLSGSPRKGGCVRAKFKPAEVRIEGFDCRDRDRRNCSIPAVA
ncbi:hypothetical protein GIB67_012655 [Kingdonia uniflora]|uniref:Uncharacterized protein n=1 Tax=Kingdonia uniflora TaxID=39325 RepID=A0A7J7NFW3_9MAGN|nr:hypothetical protein GIB67_012655 [Kingdonia uniflora]